MVVATLLVAGLTPIPADPWWKDSPTIARMMPLVDWAASYLPESIAEHLDFEPELPGQTGEGDGPAEKAPSTTSEEPPGAST